MKNKIEIISTGSHRPVRQVLFLENGIQEVATVCLLRNGGIQIVSSHLTPSVVDDLTRELGKIQGFIEFDKYQDLYQQDHKK